jgi:uncharacterized membrane protein YcaP (DUF421 family)
MLRGDACFRPLTAFVTCKWSRIRNVVEGEPVILVEDGTLIERVMRNERLTPEVTEHARPISIVKKE